MTAVSWILRLEGALGESVTLSSSSVSSLTPCSTYRSSIAFSVAGDITVSATWGFTSMKQRRNTKLFGTCTYVHVPNAPEWRYLAALAEQGYQVSIKYMGCPIFQTGQRRIASSQRTTFTTRINYVLISRTKRHGLIRPLCAKYPPDQAWNQSLTVFR